MDQTTGNTGENYRDSEADFEKKYISILRLHTSFLPQGYRTHLSFTAHWLGPSFVLRRNISNAIENS
jgi:hypothetical protein